MDNLKSGDAGGKKTLVEEGTQFKGSLTSSCPVVVRGRVEGDV
jgi:cytoskeletal protein CcmA (bactofilin family)